MRKKIIEEGGVKIGTHTLEYRFSAGVQTLENESSLEELIKHADEKLYVSKEQGRDKITL